MRKYTVFFLIQEEPEAGKKREVLHAVPTVGSMSFKSNATSYGGLLKEFRELMTQNVDKDFLDTLSLASDKEIAKYS